MAETPDHTKRRLALFARDAIAAKSDYQLEKDAVVARTERLRAERLAREAVIILPTARQKGRPTASTLTKASKAQPRVQGRRADR